jgi:hypothetical protein
MEATGHQSKGRLFGIGCLALLAVIGFDLFLHAGVLVRLYSEPTPFLLAPEVAFSRIPLGYMSFAVLVLLLEWLMVRLGTKGLGGGTVLGLKLGALVWGSFALGLASISTARPVLLLSWAVGQTVELGLAGAVIGSAFAPGSLRRLVWQVLALFVGLVVLGVVIQNVLVQ